MTDATGEGLTTDAAKEASLDEVERRLATGGEGLSSHEAAARLARYGPNEIVERRTNPVVKFLMYFWGPIPFMIEAAAVISALIRHWPDLVIILVLLFTNAVVGFWQEHKADNAIELLKRRLAPSARVRRDGAWRDLPARELVPGDLVRVRLGNIVPADVKLLEGDFLLADESALTGESLPVEKHVGDVAYESAIARQGEMNGLVVTTGMSTFFGKTTRLVAQASKPSHFQRAIVRIGDYLIALAIVLVAVIFAVAMLRHESLAQTLQFALVLTVAAIPAALPAVLSVSMAVGALELAKRQAIVSRLTAIEEAAGMDVLCSDKTGTITQNRLTVGDVRPVGDATERDVHLMAALASREEDHDPIDDAVIVGAREQEGVPDALASFKVIAFKPFDPVAKRTEATVRGPDGRDFKVVKGAVQVVLEQVGGAKGSGTAVARDVEDLAGRGYRALGVARTDAEGRWALVGILGLHDPPREDSAETIRTAEAMGIDVKMVTGDHQAIARETARQVSLPTDIITADDLGEGDDPEAARRVEAADGFAQVFPEHKHRIVELLQQRDHIVGMTGDGVNDAPALKRADVGVAVSGSTDAAKSAADIVLTSPGLGVIVDAVKESRKIFQRMNNYALYRISETVRVLFFITLSIIVFSFYPITALMIVLLAILNDLPIIAIAYDNVRYRNCPERWDMRTLLGVSTTLGVLGVVETFVLLSIGLSVLRLDHAVLQSFIYLKLSVAGHLLLLMARTRGPFWSVRPARPLLAAILLTQLAATLITVYGVLLPAMGWLLAAYVWGYCLVVLFLIDGAKVAIYRYLDRGRTGPTDIAGAPGACAPAAAKERAAGRASTTDPGTRPTRTAGDGTRNERIPPRPRSTAATGGS